MSFHFTQEMSMRRTGFGNAVMAEVGVPTPISAEFEYLSGPGCEVVGFDQHPYLAATGYGNLDGSDFPEQAVQSCGGVLVLESSDSPTEIETEVIYSKDYSSQPSFWGIEGEPSGFEFEVEYDSTVRAFYNLDRCSFAFVDVRRSDGTVDRYLNVACLPKREWQATASYRMWGQTDSWGSEGERVLFIPWQDTRDW